MLINQGGVTKNDYSTRKTILFDAENFVAVSAKITGQASKVLAGTPVKGSLTDRDTAYTVAGASDTPIGILLHDVECTKTSEAKNVSVLIFGFVDESKLDSTVVTKLDSAMKAKLTKITFLK